MKKDDEIMKKRPFMGEKITDDLVDWAGKLKALGEVWGTLSWHENQGHVSSCTLEMCGEALGSIIQDYAEMIEYTVTENIQSIVNLDKDIVARLDSCRKFYNRIKDGHWCPADISVIDFRLNELTSFINGAAIPAIGLKEDFTVLRKSIQTRLKEKAPAGVSAAAGA